MRKTQSHVVSKHPHLTSCAHLRCFLIRYYFYNSVCIWNELLRKCVSNWNRNFRPPLVCPIKYSYDLENVTSKMSEWYFDCLAKWKVQYMVSSFFFYLCINFVYFQKVDCCFKVFSTASFLFFLKNNIVLFFSMRLLHSPPLYIGKYSFRRAYK